VSKLFNNSSKCIMISHILHSNHGFLRSSDTVQAKPQKNTINAICVICMEGQSVWADCGSLVHFLFKLIFLKPRLNHPPADEALESPKSKKEDQRFFHSWT
jgi:hypothetical protein